MDLNASLNFRAKISPVWIKEDKETEFIDILFDNGYGEVILSFESEAFKSLALAINQFLSSGEMNNLNSHKKGCIDIDLSIPLYEKRIAVNVDLGDCPDSKPGLLIEVEGKRLMELYFNLKQAKEIEDRCRKICEIYRLTKEVEKKRTIQATG